MRRQVWLFAVFAVLVVHVSAAFPCPAQTRQPPTSTVSPTLYIRGSLRDGDNSRPMEMIKVDLKRMTGEVVSTAFTRSNGEFEFTGLPRGVYYIVVEERGFEPVRESVELLSSSRMGIYIFLKRPLVITTREPGTTISARELTIPRKALEAMQKGKERLYGKQQDRKGSLPHFRRAVTEFPSYYEAYMQMGLAYMHLEQTADAEEALRKSIEVSENRFPDAYFALASLLTNHDRFAEAEVAARRGLELDAGGWIGYYELARALVGLNHVEAAEKNAQEARARKPDFPALHLVLANIHIRKRDYPALLEDLNRYLELEPSGPMSDQALQTRDKIQRALANAQNPGSAPANKP